MRRDPGPDSGQDGFAAVDALVAVTILSSSLVLSLAAAQAGVRAGRAADETRRAELLMRERLEGSPERGGVWREGVWRGRDQGLDWRVKARLLGDPAKARAGGLVPCERVATARANRTGRTYRLATVGVCAAAPQAEAEGAGA